MHLEHQEEDVFEAEEIVKRNSVKTCVEFKIIIVIIYYYFILM